MTYVFPKFPGWNTISELRVKKAPFILKGAFRHFIDFDFGTNQFEELLDKKHSANEDFLQISKDGVLIYPKESKNQLLDRSEIVEFYRQGHTIICNYISKDIPKLYEAKNNLENILLEEIECSAFLTPAGSQGFSAHFDSADLFIVQTNGSKKWALYEKLIEDPLESQKATVTEEEISKLIFREVLEIGDVLYIPRGIVHEGKGSFKTNVPSIHISFGILTNKIVDMLKGYLDELSLRESWLREDVKATMNLEEQIDKLISALNDKSLAKYYKSKIISNILMNRMDRHQVKLMNSLNYTYGYLNESAFLRKKYGIQVKFCDLTPQKLIYTSFEGVSSVEIPFPAVKFVKKILSYESSFMIKDILVSSDNNLDEKNAYVTVRKLISIGILEFE